MRLPTSKLLLAACGLALLAPAWPAAAQSTGFVTGIPGPDPAGGDEIGWGPAYRPETSFAQPGTPPTPGDFAGAAYRARTGHGVYDRVEGPNPYGRMQDARGTRPVGLRSETQLGATPGQVARTHHASRSAMQHRRHARHRAKRQAPR